MSERHHRGGRSSLHQKQMRVVAVTLLLMGAVLIFGLVWLVNLRW